MVTKAIFFDRDGVLNELVHRAGSTVTAPWRIEELVIIETAIEAVRKARQIGFKTFIVSNQPDLHDNLMTWQDHEAILNCIKLNFDIDEIVYAFVRSGIDYKPKTGMVDYLCAKYNINRSKSYMIGDRWKDVVCGKRSGLHTIIINNLHYGIVPDKYTPGKYVPDHWVNSALDGVNMIEELESEKHND